MTGLDRAGRGDLHYAALERDLDTVRRLLAEGADPSAPDAAGYTPLHFAAQSDSLEVVRELLAAGSDVAAQNRFGATPLHVSLMNCDEAGAVIVALLDGGSDPDLDDGSGITPRKLADTISNFDFARHFQGR